MDKKPNKGGDWAVVNLVLTRSHRRSVNAREWNIPRRKAIAQTRLRSGNNHAAEITRSPVHRSLGEGVPGKHVF